VLTGIREFLKNDGLFVKAKGEAARPLAKADCHRPIFSRGRLAFLPPEGNNPENQNLALWFCVRPGPTPFLAFGTPARFRVTGAASCGHYATGAAGGKNYRPLLVCDSREFASRCMHRRRQAMAVRRLYEPLCITFSTTVSSPTVPPYQLYDLLPHKFTPRLYMESADGEAVAVLPAAGNAAAGSKPALTTSSQLSEPLRAGAPHPQPQCCSAAFPGSALRCRSTICGPRTIP
jgi:hypothetical protein